MEQKVIFFDIDGTLINFGGEFPESAKKALEKAKGNGHKIFICSGRSKCQVEKRLIDIGNSKKDRTNSRGFRGIGRLAGLGYCNQLVFSTSYLGE